MNNKAPLPAIRLENVSCWFESQEVLRNLCISVHRGESLAIIGESGCGKSVTMKVMMQLLTSNSGRVLWFERDVNHLSSRDRQATRLQFGYLFQGAALFDSLNIFENVAFGLRENTSLTDDEIQDTVLQRLDDVGLNRDVTKKRPAELSGGMQKRVGLARALALDPQVMFYDEPTTGLDPLTSRRIDDLIDSVREHHSMSSVVVTHDMRTVERVADRVIMLAPCHRLQTAESQILFEGSVEELFRTTDPNISEFVHGSALEQSAGTPVSHESAAA
ncbi:MAG: ATP-binding cassette domain-containing protein [Fuerstiella sp.]|nr:ATP-binding cassette domain-containing protein [Fuerstiella sp.]